MTPVTTGNLALASVPDEPAMARLSEQHAALYDEHYGFVMRALRRLGTPTAYIEDAAHDTFMVCFAADLRPVVSLKAWLFGICRNICRNYRRKSMHSTRTTSGDSGEVSLAQALAPSPETALATTERVRQLDQWLSQLPEPEREAFVLLELEGEPAEKVAEALQVPLTTLYGRAQRARQELQRQHRRQQLGER